MDGKPVLLLRKILLFLIILTLLLLGACNGRGSVNLVPNDSLVSLIDIDSEALSNLISNQSDFIVLISSATCSSCAEFEPIILEYITQNHLPIYRIEADEAFPSDNSIVDYDYTPTLVLFDKGVIVSHVDPFTDEVIFVNLQGLTDYFDRYVTIGETSKT